LKTTKTFPKILLVCGFSQKTANGITIANLFKHWPSDSIALLEYHTDIEDVLVPNIKNYYFIGNNESIMVWPFNYLQKIRASNIIKIAKGELLCNEKNNILSPNNGSWLQKKATSIFFGLKMNFLKITGLVYISRKFNISLELDKWIKDFNPEIIYGTTEDIEKMNFLFSLKKKYNIKLALHIFDDWIHSGHRYFFLKHYWNKKALTIFKSLLGISDIRLTISDKMAIEFQDKYKMCFYSFHNPVDPNVWNLKDATAVKTIDSSFTFVYTGILNIDTIGPILNFIKSLEHLHHKGYKIDFHIYSPYDSTIARYHLGANYDTYFKGRAKYEHIPIILANADGLLLPLAFTKKSINYVRLSMPTKATEYMMSGTPIFIYAPAEIALTEYFSKYNAAYIQTSENDIANSVLEFVTNKEMRKLIVSNALDLVHSMHTNDSVTNRLLNIFNEQRLLPNNA
jgi:glycosyltransferase involved in cell wall biosynthesis